MMRDMATLTYQLTDKALGGELDARLRVWRAAGVSYRSIARLLSDELGVDLVDETIRRWCRDLDDTVSPTTYDAANEIAPAGSCRPGLEPKEQHLR